MRGRICLNSCMSEKLHAAVFNETPALFNLAAGTVHYTGKDSSDGLAAPMADEAPALWNYIADYTEHVVRPTVATLVEQENVPADNYVATFFETGAFMTFRMIRNVSMDTLAELPPLDYRVSGVPETVDPPNENPKTPLIDVAYRGSEFRATMPHVYGASLLLMEEALGEPATRFVNLDKPISEHKDLELAWEELHFIAGAAETALTIEAWAAAYT